jgi:arylsulfatase A-like enzyme
MNRLVGTHDLLWVTLDTLRYDVASAELAAGRTPELARVLPGGAWEKRHAPGSFTFASHQAFFAGFLPTPEGKGPHPRPFALRFAGSESTARTTCVLEGATVVEGLALRGYRTVCIGGVGFFNKENALGRVLPGLFQESHWSRAMGVTDPHSTEHQVRLAERVLAETPREQRLFLFLNVSALHQPNRHHLPGAGEDSVETHAAALRYVDGWLGRLFAAFRERGPAHCTVMSDHGTAYGEDGYHGHRLAHPVVWTVPYAEFVLGGEGEG